MVTVPLVRRKNLWSEEMLMTLPVEDRVDVDDVGLVEWIYGFDNLGKHILIGGIIISARLNTNGCGQKHLEICDGRHIVDGVAAQIVRTAIDDRDKKQAAIAIWQI